MKVYVVTQGEYSDYRIKAVFSSEDLAKQYMEYFEAEKYDHYNPIEEYEVDAGDWDRIRSGVKWYEVRRLFNGEWRCDQVKSATETKLYHQAENPFRGTTLGPTGTQFTTCVETDSKERALKVASERYARVVVDSDMEGKS